MKKLFMILLVLVMSMVTLVGCSEEEEASSEQITLTYLSWDCDPSDPENLEMQMIAKYEEENPNVDIEPLAPSTSGDTWNEQLATLASAGNLPDVFVLETYPEAVQNGWLYDITEIAEADEEFMATSDITRKHVTYGESIYAVPRACNMKGFYVNNDLLAQYNLDPLEFGYTMDEFKNVVAATSNPAEGTVALEDVHWFMEWYPATVDPTLGYYAIGEDGNLHLDSPAMVECAETMADFTSLGYSYNSLTPEEQTAIAASGWDAWAAGSMAFYYDGTWNAGYYETEVPFDCTFIGFPNSTVTLNYSAFGIASSTEYPEEAYDFAKYMSTYGEAGLTARMEVFSENGLTFSEMPLTTDQEILDQYWAMYADPELRPIWEEANSGGDVAVVELQKAVPGMINVVDSGKIGVPIGDIPDPTVNDFWNAVCTGVINYNDYAAQLNEWANQFLDDSAAAIEEAIQ